jgi:hypothetical protein
MKKIILAVFILVICTSCSTKIINVDGKDNNEQTSFEAFNDENYVWEGWTFSTNKVQKIK